MTVKMCLPSVLARTCPSEYSQGVGGTHISECAPIVSTSG